MPSIDLNALLTRYGCEKNARFLQGDLSDDALQAATKEINALLKRKSEPITPEQVKQARAEILEGMATRLFDLGAATQKHREMTSTDRARPTHGGKCLPYRPRPKARTAAKQEFNVLELMLADKDEPKASLEKLFDMKEIKSPEEFVARFEPGLYPFSVRFRGAVHSGLLMVYEQNGDTRFFATELMGAPNPGIVESIAALLRQYTTYGIDQFGGQFRKDGMLHEELAHQILARDKRCKFDNRGFDDFYARLGSEAKRLSFWKPIVTFGGKSHDHLKLIDKMQQVRAQWMDEFPKYGAFGPNCSTFAHLVVFHTFGPGVWKHVPVDLGSVGESSFEPIIEDQLREQTSQADGGTASGVPPPAR